MTRPEPRRKLKVVHVISTLPLGGAEKSLFLLVSRLDRERFDPVVVCLRDEGALAPLFRQAGIRVELVKLSSRLGPGSMLRLARFFRREKADIVHTHLRRPNTSGRLAAWLAGVPVIIAHERNADRERTRRHFLTDRLLSHVSSAIIAVSPAVAEFQSAGSGVPLERYTVIPNAVDLDEFKSRDRQAAREALGMPAEAYIVGFSGRLHPTKNVDLLLAAASRILPELPQLRLLIVGDGKERGSLETLAARLGVRERVTFLGERRDMPAIYPAMDVLCLPSRWEGCSRALLEAAACGVPLVASGVGFAPELVGEDEAGVLVTVGSVEELVSALTRLGRDPGLRSRMGEAALRRVAPHGLDGYVRQVERFYLDLWSARASRAMNE